jgi:molybdopterin converting factor small subunit
MRVTVKFLGALREQVGSDSLPVELPAGGTYRDVLDAIGPVAQARLPDWAWDPAGRSFSGRMIVSLNGSGGLRDQAVQLSDGDEILVVLPLGGG